MIQEVEIDQEHIEYYAYLNRLHNEIAAYLLKNDGFMDSHKLDLFFDKISLTFVVWQEKMNKGSAQSHKLNQEPFNQDERKSWMLALEKKYGLIKKDGKYTLKAPVDREKFKEIAGKMKAAGYSYDSGKKGFVEVKQ